MCCDFAFLTQFLGQEYVHFCISLIERLRQVTDRISRQILCIEAHGNATTLTIRVSLRTIGPRSMSPELSPPCSAANLQLAWELLEWVEGLSPSF